MFGIFYTMAMGISSLFHNIKQDMEESVRKDKAKDSYDHTYYDKKGKRILLDNNRWVCSAVRNGDRVLEDVETRQIYRNFSKEQRDDKCNKNKKEAVQKGYRAYLFIDQKDRKDDYKWKGNLYKDLKTGDVYAIITRHITEYNEGIIDLYVNVETNEIIDKSDEQRYLFDIKWKKKLQNLKNDNLPYIENIARKKGWSREQTENELIKLINKKQKYILKNYVPEDNMSDYLIMINKKQQEYKNKKDDLYWYSLNR